MKIIVRYQSIAYALILAIGLLTASLSARAATISYLQIPSSLALVPPIPNHGLYNLPLYGLVEVSWTGLSSSNPTYQDQAQTVGNHATNRGPSPGCPLCSVNSESWLSDTQDFNIFNQSANTLSYDFTFTFSNPPPLGLVLVVDALLSGTTLKVTQSNGATGKLIGEYLIPPDVNYVGSSTTNYDPLTGTFSSSADHDLRNTGWALYQPDFTSLGNGIFTLNLHVDQLSGDGLGFTIGNRVPEPSVVALFSIALASLSLAGRNRARRFHKRA